MSSTGSVMPSSSSLASSTYSSTPYPTMSGNFTAPPMNSTIPVSTISLNATSLGPYTNVSTTSVTAVISTTENEVITSGGSVITTPIVTLATVTTPADVIVTTLPNGQVVTTTFVPEATGTGIVPVIVSSGNRNRAFAIGALGAFVAAYFCAL